MERDATSRIMLTLLLTITLTLAFNVQLSEASGTIYITANGKVDPPTAPIQRDKNVYTFTDNIYDSIVVERDDIVIDGAGYALQGTGVITSKGISSYGRINLTIKNIEIKAFHYGIYFSGSSNNTIHGNIITNNTHGIWLEDSSNYNSIFGNNITTNKRFGIIHCFSSNNSISGNNVTDNYYGIGLVGARAHMLRDNSITNNKHNFRVLGWALSDFANDVDDSNTADGKPIYYWVSKRDMAVPIDAGYVALVNCTSITVQNLNLSNNGQGLLLAYTTNSTITKNSITNNQYGIHLVYSSNNTIYGNNITANNNYGIYLDGSSNNKFHHNNFTDNTQQAYILQPGFANIWDDGFPSGGNYWSNYAGADDNGDGIGDSPYIIDSDNTDRYPLIITSMIPEDTTSPSISFLSPENKTYTLDDVHLTFTLSESTSWIAYSLDGQMNVTITGNTTLSGLSNGPHNLIVYANDTAGNIGHSIPIYFSIETQQAEPFPTWIVVAIAIVTVVGVALLFYFAHARIALRARTH